MTNPINLNSFRNFLKSETSGGIILIICVVVSLIIANSPLGPAFAALLDKVIGFKTDSVDLEYSIASWINDGLMAIFFLLVGLEIKRELVEGELSSIKQASLPILAALGGVIVPALIYHSFNIGLETDAGWAIPMATDIAFAVAIITMLGKNVPVSLKIFLAALAIVDDLMAILVIATFYSTSLEYTYLLYAAGFVVLLIIFNRLGVKNLAFYLIPGAFIWYFIHHSGIHATIAGVITAFTLPTTPDAKESPLEKLEHILINPVNFIIIPIFALANTNITFESGMVEGLFTPLGFGIILGLFIGKPVGIFLASWIAIKFGISKMPDRAHWIHILGVGMIAGIGFTMSIFISLLSFSNSAHLMSEAKFSILIGSLLSAIMGSLLLIMVTKKEKRIEETAS
ncbi:Na+/H+ antiporter NhaA [Albibacterium sp.]|uniref:Na+/H+ antiporter NhaA n=1 Tax=Albibacterium sp. TaxID=2952885 RepID=UPI002D0EE9B4|nr:Na+/H+ antiporter NhaA [Albibacterium sp.]HUH19309.1 Na+/H+ antiporter NhaA [Albibacterium sp.]